MEEIETLAKTLGERAKARGVTVASAESCTGGLIGAAMTSVAGSSVWFDRGFVTYTVASKTEMLDVDSRLIESEGVVSEPVARAMAVGALNHSKANLSVAVTGVAGPSGGTEKTPVGTVCFGFAFKVDSKICAESSTQRFEGDRNSVRKAALEFALKTLVEILGP